MHPTRLSECLQKPENCHFQFLAQNEVIILGLPEACRGGSLACRTPCGHVQRIQVCPNLQVQSPQLVKTTDSESVWTCNLTGLFSIEQWLVANDHMQRSLLFMNIKKLMKRKMLRRKGRFFSFAPEIYFKCIADLLQIQLY